MNVKRLTSDELASYCEEHNLTGGALAGPFRRAFELVHFSEREVAEELQRNQPRRSSWGLMWRMLCRCTEHAHATLVMWAAGYPAQAEALSRAVLEHAVTIMFVLRDDSDGRFAQCLFDFLRKEERNITQLKQLSDPEMRKDLEQRSSALSLRKKVVADLVAELGVDVSNLPEWPHFAGRCKELGIETDYRLYYYHLSAQLHADPEDLLNELVANVSKSVERLAVETVAFSWTLTKAGLGLYLRALAEFSTRLCSGSATATIAASSSELETLELSYDPTRPPVSRRSEAKA